MLCGRIKDEWQSEIIKRIKKAMIERKWMKVWKIIRVREKWLRWFQDINDIIDNKNLEIININFKRKEREISKDNAKWEKKKKIRQLYEQMRDGCYISICIS